MMNTATQIKSLLNQLSLESPPSKAVFFKMGVGDYAEHDQFIGVSVPDLRKVAKQFSVLSLTELQLLLDSPINEERLLALLILVSQYQKSSAEEKGQFYHFYMRNLKHVNNWNLVDASAHLIAGDYLHSSTNKDILLVLAKSDNLWERRIAIVATWHFIRQGSYQWTLRISEILLKDSHDLIHKAVGWMLRETGKKDLKVLKDFLDQRAAFMPRTMLRYALEKLPPDERNVYLKKGKV